MTSRRMRTGSVARRGEIWRVGFDTPSLGSEPTKERPAVIISSDALGVLPLKVVVPITGWQPSFARQSWKVELHPDANNGLNKISAADTLQVSAVSVQRLVRKTGVMDPDTLRDVLLALATLTEME